MILNTRMRIFAALLSIFLLSFALTSCLPGGTDTDSGTTDRGEGTSNTETSSENLTGGGEEDTTPPVDGTTSGEDGTTSPKPNFPLPETQPSDFPNDPEPDGTKRY